MPIPSGDNQLDLSPETLFKYAESLDNVINEMPRGEVSDLNGDKLWLEKVNSSSLVTDTLGEMIQSVL